MKAPKELNNRKIMVGQDILGTVRDGVFWATHLAAKYPGYLAELGIGEEEKKKPEKKAKAKEATDS